MLTLNPLPIFRDNHYSAHHPKSKRDHLVIELQTRFRMLSVGRVVPFQETFAALAHPWQLGLGIDRLFRAHHTLRTCKRHARFTIRMVLTSYYAIPRQGCGGREELLLDFFLTSIDETCLQYSGGSFN